MRIAFLLVLAITLGGCVFNQFDYYSVETMIVDETGMPAVGMPGKVRYSSPEIAFNRPEPVDFTTDENGRAVVTMGTLSIGGQPMISLSPPGEYWLFFVANEQVAGGGTAYAQQQDNPYVVTLRSLGRVKKGD